MEISLDGGRVQVMIQPLPSRELLGSFRELSATLGHRQSISEVLCIGLRTPESLFSSGSCFPSSVSKTLSPST